MLRSRILKTSMLSRWVYGRAWSDFRLCVNHHTIIWLHLKSTWIANPTSSLAGHILKPYMLGRWDVAEPGLAWERLMQNKNKELDRLNDVYMNLLNKAGVKYIEGRGTLVDAHTVQVNGKQYTVSGS